MPRWKKYCGKREITADMFLRRIEKLSRADILVHQLDTCPFCLGKLIHHVEEPHRKYYRINCSNCSFICTGREE